MEEEKRGITSKVLFNHRKCKKKLHYLGMTWI